MKAKPFTLKCQNTNVTAQCVIYCTEFLTFYNLFVNDRQLRWMSEIYFDFGKKDCAIANFYSQLCYGYQIT